MTEIMILGTFHFSDDPIDIFSDSVQDELEKLAIKLSKFNPDAIAVEYCIREQKAVSNSYQKLNIEDFKNYEKMRSETLGEIFLWGANRKIGYKGEAIQIGYRLGKLLNLSDIYAVDEDLELDDTSAEIIINELSDELSEANSKLYYPETSLAEKLVFYNSTEWSKAHHSLYIRANAIKHGNDYVGSNWVSGWYERNLKIFSNIQRLAENHKKIFIVYGAGHLQILLDLINSDDALKLVEATDYL